VVAPVQPQQQVRPAAVPPPVQADQQRLRAEQKKAQDKKRADDKKAEEKKQ
jgi:hypothetical protein